MEIEGDSNELFDTNKGLTLDIHAKSDPTPNTDSEDTPDKVIDDQLTVEGQPTIDAIDDSKDTTEKVICDQHTVEGPPPMNTINDDKDSESDFIKEHADAPVSYPADDLQILQTNDMNDDIFNNNEPPEMTENIKLRIMDDYEEHIVEGPMNEISLDDGEDNSIEDGLMDEVNLDEDNSVAKKESSEPKLYDTFSHIDKEDYPEEIHRDDNDEILKQTTVTFAATPVKSSPTAPSLNTVSEQGEFINISVTSPHKVGDGITSYMAYKVKTTTNIQNFKKKELSVTRRFSDFLGLRDKLNDKYARAGRIVPSAPDKSVVGMTKTKISKDDENSDQSEFIEKRRVALERYLTRTATHSVLLNDPDFREFLELNTELPKANQTSTLSGKNVMKMFSKMGDKVSSYTTKMEEPDSWFEEKTNMIDNLESQLNKVLYSTDALVGFRKTLAGQTYSVSKSITALGHAEEDTKLSAALDQLGDVYMEIQKVHDQQSKDDLFLLSELVHDYLGLVAAIKDVLAERVKAWQHWQSVIKDLNRKREYKVKLDVSGKADKLAELKSQISETERQQESAQDVFDKISATFKEEIENFEAKKCQDFKANLVDYLEKMLKGQETVATQWERYLPEIKQCGA